MTLANFAVAVAVPRLTQRGSAGSRLIRVPYQVALPMILIGIGQGAG
jgi:hypothetical protein